MVLHQIVDFFFTVSFGKVHQTAYPIRLFTDIVAGQTHN